MCQWLLNCYLQWSVARAWEPTVPNLHMHGMSAFVLDTKMTPRSRDGAWAEGPLEVLAPRWTSYGVCIQPNESWSGGGWQVGWWGTASCIAMGLTRQQKHVREESVCVCGAAFKVEGRAGIGVWAETRHPVVLASDWYWVFWHTHTHTRGES